MLSKHQTLKKISTSAQELKNSTHTLFQFRQSNQHCIPLDLEINQLCQLWFLCNPLPQPSCDEPRHFPRFQIWTLLSGLKDKLVKISELEKSYSPGGDVLS